MREVYESFFYTLMSYTKFMDFSTQLLHIYPPPTSFDDFRRDYCQIVIYTAASIVNRRLCNPNIGDDFARKKLISSSSSNLLTCIYAVKNQFSGPLIFEKFRWKFSRNSSELSWAQTGIRASLGVIHKPRGHFLGLFWPSSPFRGDFYKIRVV